MGLTVRVDVVRNTPQIVADRYDHLAQAEGHEPRAYLDARQFGAVRCTPARAAHAVFITLNGEPYDIDQPLTVADLLIRLAIDARRVAVEHNLEILRRALYADTMVHEGDRIEIVNFVGGGSGPVCI